ncbi:MAG TPA: 30S ribosomal protein S8e [Candidatus Nanoarchaeia archaeon]|nr:30S ribosomal protein S8e [Candidatus Nanoarchaeia archaeon]
MNNGRKITGGKYHAIRKKRSFEGFVQSRPVLLGTTKRKQLRMRGGAQKTILLKSDEANVMIKGKVQKAKIVNVEQTPQNPFLARQNRLMKGAIIATSLGKAKITNRPSQEGLVNAVLVESK